MDFAGKMEELFDDMGSLFDGLGSEANLEVALENVPNISGNISSLTGWREEVAPTETPTKPAQPRPSKPAREAKEEEPMQQPKSEQTSKQQEAELVRILREIHVDNMAEHLLGELQTRRDQASRSETPQ